MSMSTFSGSIKPNSRTSRSRARTLVCSIYRALGSAHATALGEARGAAAYARAGVTLSQAVYDLSEIDALIADGDERVIDNFFSLRQQLSAMLDEDVDVDDDRRALIGACRIALDELERYFAPRRMY